MFDLDEKGKIRLLLNANELIKNLSLLYFSHK